MEHNQYREFAFDRRAVLHLPGLPALHKCAWIGSPGVPLSGERRDIVPVRLDSVLNERRREKKKAAVSTCRIKTTMVEPELDNAGITLNFTYVAILSIHRSTRFRQA
jgi:hypothetical protein